MKKLTKAQDGLQAIIARAAISVAERHPTRRGPWIFDEQELQKTANMARAFLTSNQEGNDEA